MCLLYRYRNIHRLISSLFFFKTFVMVVTENNYILKKLQKINFCTHFKC